ncbi:MAG: hypothetical protein ACK4N5_07285 [Myxococcales bacterium]
MASDKNGETGPQSASEPATSTNETPLVATNVVTSDAGEQQTGSPNAAQIATVLPPMPPGTAGSTNLTVALGMQLMQGSALSSLPDPVKREIISLADKMDQRQFEHAQNTMQLQAKSQSEQLQDHASGRREILSLTWRFGVGLLVCGTAIVLALIFAGKPDIAQFVLKDGLALVGAMFGGAGLSSVFRRYVGSGKESGK